MFKFASFLMLALIIIIDLLSINLFRENPFNYNLIFIMFNLNAIIFFFIYLCFIYKKERYKQTKLSGLSWGLLGFMAAGVPASIIISLTFGLNYNNTALFYSILFCVFNLFLFIGIYLYKNRGKHTHKYKREITIIEERLNTIGEGRYNTVYEMHRLKRDGLFPTIIVEILILLSLIAYWIYNKLIFDYICYGLVVFALSFLALYGISHLLKYSYSNNSKSLNV